MKPNIACFREISGRKPSQIFCNTRTEACEEYLEGKQWRVKAEKEVQGCRKYPQASGMSSEPAFAAVLSRLTTSFENLGARTALSFRWRTITNVLLTDLQFYWGHGPD